MRKILFLAVLLCSAVCFAQVRWDEGGPIGGVTTVVNQPSINGTTANYLIILAPVTLHWCQSPANSIQGVPCTNYAPTYTDLTLATPCSSTQPITLQNSNVCQSASDILGNLGVNTVAGTYTYTLTSGSTTYGPFTITLGGGGGSSGVLAGPGISVTQNPVAGTATVSLLQALPNGETATTQPAGDISPDVATDAFVNAALASTGLLPQTGCGVEWTGNLNFTVGACSNYTINGIQYSSLLTNVTLTTADPTNPRLDVIAVDNTGSVVVITGIPAVTPAVPTVDPSSQLSLDTILVPAASTTPAVTKGDIYHENLQGPTEWNTTASGAAITLASTVNPYDGTKDVEATSPVTGNYAQFTVPSSGTVQMQNYNSQIFYLRSKAAWPSTASLAVQWYSGATPLGTAVLIRNTGTFGFNSAITTAYQQISIATSTFGINGVPATSVRLTVVGTGGMNGWYLDDITLQGGQNGNPNAAFETWRGTWNTTTGYNPNDEVFDRGVSWIALVANTNSEPSLVNTNWAPKVSIGTNQQVIYNCATYLCGNSGMLFNDVLGNFTITGTFTGNKLSLVGGPPLTVTGAEGTAPGGVVGSDILWADSTGHCWKMNNNNGGATGCLGTGSGTVTSITFNSPLSGGTITTSGTVGINANGITATQLAAQYSKGSCTEVWGGSGTSNAMQSGDDAIVNNACYNDSGVTRTITALKCRSDNAANTTVLTPTFGSAGTGTAILTGTVTCGNSYAYSVTGTLNNTAWTTGTGIDPGMSTVGNATSIAMIVEYTY